MKNTILATALSCVVALVVSISSCTTVSQDNKLIILHVNDTHSQIGPDSKGLGGVMRRMALLDSIRQAEDNVLLVDAGDAVQGTLYFYLYGGEVEQKVMNMLGVDMRILGNHEFDNGIEPLAMMLRHSDAVKIATNYNLENSVLKGMFQQYEIKEFDGKKIAFIGINLDPKGMISDGNYDGVEFRPIVATANEVAAKLKSEDNVDAVVAITHIGYNPGGLIGDSILAANSHDIDIIIGGHSHDLIEPDSPRSRMTNLDGEPVLIVQTGKIGRYVGKIEIDLDSIGLGAVPSYELIPIDSRFESYHNPKLAELLKHYSAGVDSLMCDWIGTTTHPLNTSDPELLNFFSDYIFERGSEIAPGVDLAIANKGGLRADIPEGKFSKGHIINMVPFTNYITVVDILGKDLAEVFDVMAVGYGNGISENVSVIFTDQDSLYPTIKSIKINGKILDKNKTYRVATIDYLANGGDYMTGFTRGKIVATSRNLVYDDLIKYFTEGKYKVLEASTENRWKLVK